MDNRSHEEAQWDLEVLGPEVAELRGLDFDLALTGFDPHEIDDLLAEPGAATRRGVDRFVRDDPHNVQEAESYSIRKTTLDWWEVTMSTSRLSHGTEPSKIPRRRIT
jgi:hypothetical protein